ncbi:MAG: pyridoxal phosphate-dependent aminotransferase [Bacteroidia bacterium]|nr:pyridoxal phosphate-dependent aminotransferase [Bacteroidia bacterium]
MAETIKNTMLSDRILNMTESATLKMTQLARDLRAQGNDVISLSIGEPDFDTPQHIKDAAIKALNDGWTKYTPVPGLPVLREAISQKFERENGLEYAPSQIVVSNGAKQSISNIAQAMLNPGDEVIIFTPYWVSYSDIVKLAGGVVIPVQAGIEQDFKVTPDQVQNAITDKTKLVLFSSPCNPTGSVYTKEELNGIAAVLAPHEHIYIISDEIYEHINFTDAHCSIGAFPSVKDRTITVNGFSKGFAMTGWRLGYMGAPPAIAKACAKHQGQVTSGATAFGQVAGAYALKSDLGPTEAMKAAFEKRKHVVIELLQQIPGFKVNNPKGAFYIFPDISNYFGKSDGTTTINNADDFSMYILNTAFVSIVSGSAFGDDNCFRLSYAASEEQLREAIGRIHEAVSRLH